MKTLKYFILVILFIPCFAYGNQDDTVRYGDKALLFAISEGSLHPQNFMGGLGFEYFLNHNMGLRMPLGWGYSNVFGKKPVNAESDKSETTWNISFVPGIRFDIGRGKRVVAYAGAQLLFEYGSNILEGNDFKSNTTSTSTLTYGVGGFIGAEWMPWRSFGIALEYQPFLTFKSGTRVYESSGFTQKDVLPKETNFNLNRTSILLVLSFYFY